MAIITSAIAPAIAIMTFVYLSKRMELEPLPLIVRMFVIGILIVFPIMFIQYTFANEGIFQTSLVKSFFLAGLLEEFFKWFFLLFVAYRHAAFDHHYDGIIYGVSISLGFATIENIIYLFANGIEIAILRAVFPVSSHALFGILMGYYIGKAKFTNKHKRLYLIYSLALAVFLHSLYDYVVVIREHSWVFWISPFMIVLWYVGFRKIRLANEHHERMLKL